MALLTQCCCGYSVRQGSFGAGVYTLVYFLLFALLTGNYSYQEVSSRYSASSNNNTTTITATTATSAPTTPRSFTTTTTTTTNMSNNGTWRMNNTNNNNTTKNHNTNNNNNNNSSMMMMTETGGPIPTTDMVLICVDFLCEICGFVASILLLCGLHGDRRGYLVPWLIVVPLHTLIDTFTVINIIVLYVQHRDHIQGGDEEDWWGWATAATVIVDFILNFINVYAFLCVVSQYQEYLAGRGSAAYEDFRWRNGRGSSSRAGSSSVGGGVRYEVGERSTHHRGSGSGGGAGNRPNGNNPCFSDVDKSDVWCEDLVLDKLDEVDVPDPEGAEAAGRRRRSRGDEGWGHARRTNRRKQSASPSVRFECGKEEEGQEQGSSSAQGLRKGVNLLPSLKLSPQQGSSSDQREGRVTLLELSNSDS